MIILEYLKCFLTGGALCLIGQILISKTKLTPARILTGYVVAGAILSGIGVYDHIVDFGGAGATVPLTGFGHCLVNGVKAAINEDGAIGILSGGLTGAAAGIAAAIIFGFIIALIFSPHKKQ